MKEADLFSYGNNDLTQITFGFSRDETGKFLLEYIELGFFAVDPVTTIDQIGLGELVKVASERGKQVLNSSSHISLAIVAAVQAELKSKKQPFQRKGSRQGPLFTTIYGYFVD